MLLSSKKLLDEKIFKTSFPMENIILIFIARCPRPFKRNLAPQNSFSFFSWKYSLKKKKKNVDRYIMTNLISITDFIICQVHILLNNFCCNTHTNSFVDYINSFLVYKNSFVIYRLVLHYLQNSPPPLTVVFLKCLRLCIFRYIREVFKK